MAVHDCGAVVLAAGEGRRIGGPKALLRVAGEPALLRLLAGLAAAGIGEWVAVVNEAVERALGPELTERGVRTLVNRELALGPLHSLRLGLNELPEPIGAALVLPVDFPAIAPGTLGALAAAARSDRVVLPVREGRRGHPPVIGRTFFSTVHRLPLDGGLRGLYPTLPPAALRELPVDDPAIHWNLNTPADLERLNAVLSATPPAYPHAARSSR